MSIETVRIEGIAAPVSRIGLGTWAIGGWMWGGADDATSVATIRKAVDSGINLIDTAPVYGFGHSEEVVGKALEGMRDRAVIGVTVYSFARVGAAVAMNGGDLFSIANGSGCGCTRKAASATK